MELKPAPGIQDTKRKDNSGKVKNTKKMKKNPTQSFEEKELKDKKSLLFNNSDDFEPEAAAKTKRSADHDQESMKFKKAKLYHYEKDREILEEKGSMKFKHKQSKMPKSFNQKKTVLEKPNWNDFKKEKKALREKRRASEYEGDTYDVSIKAKKKLEVIKHKKCPKDVQVKELKNLHLMLKGKLLSVVYAHDMSRVIQVMLKLANTHKETNMLKDMINELMEDITGMSKKKYSIRVVETIIDIAPDAERDEIVKAFQGKVMKFLTHSIGSAAIKQLFSKLKPNERHCLQKELYGGSWKLVTSEPVTSLDVIFKIVPHMKEQTLNNTKENLLTLFEKSVVDSPMVHAVLLDYLSHSKAEDSSSMLETAQNHIKSLTSSRDGVHVAMMCTWMGTPKARKKIIKALKGEVLNLACGEHTHLILLAIFDCVDDTKFVEKVIISELIEEGESISRLLKNTYGRKVLSYLCSRRDPRLFTAPVVAVLAQGDNNPHSKKEVELRASELQKIVVPSLLNHITKNSSQWIDNHSNLVILCIVLECGSGVKLESAFVAVAKHIVSPPESKNGDIDLSRVDDTACHVILKKIAQHDEKLKEKGLATFGAALLRELSDQHILAWLTNNHCCYLLLNVLKHGSADVTEGLKLKIKKLSSKAWTSCQSIPMGGQKLQEMLCLN